MSFDKAIEFSKERRKKYKGSKSFDQSCRNHGSCDRCTDDRTYATRKAEQEADDKYKQWEDEELGNDVDPIEKDCEDDMYEEYLEWVKQQKAI